ncbi:lipid storage droplets surface-binding protein 2-like [Limulus polyphemus]|uniref:Lipid storage droplets surface-binding protein 2-like n=1 Tax=Limulus polyphemus TaxID=6850 RepID=A0ABM1B6F6_LIMPO|nr:lipid storage droplets surface-binding protein 2-like [Limulus polyphemus]XP_013775760.1 lipid storage droplets surface-binding protein 2-like [Limulus polyphemus]
MQEETGKVCTKMFHSEFIRRVSLLPVMQSALSYATTTYDYLKESSSYVKCTLTTAEKSLNFALDQAIPLVEMFEMPIQKVDYLACQGLDKLQEKAPVIKKTPEQIVSDTTELYCTVYQKGFQKYDIIKNFGIGKCQAVKDYSYQKASELLTSYIQCLLKSVDYYLPTANITVSKQIANLDQKGWAYEEVSGQIGKFCSGMKQKFFIHTLTKLLNFQEEGHQRLNKLKASLSMREVQNVAQHVALPLVGFYNHVMCVPQVLPAFFMENVILAYRCVIVLYSQLFQAKSMEQVKSMTFDNMRNEKDSLEPCVDEIINILLNMRLLQMIIPDVIGADFYLDADLNLEDELFRYPE